MTDTATPVEHTPDDFPFLVVMERETRDEADCGCVLEYLPDATVVLCPLHAAAPAMLAALERYMAGHPCEGGATCPTVFEARPLLATIDGSPPAESEALDGHHQYRPRKRQTAANGTHTLPTRGSRLVTD